ncbi:NADP-dependent oxidoreductase domain-containing protein [Mycena rosella]|uniref:NADP-dependent oxidoreductase domain-containing protein n=1 Tax=Mycena rosella TaxID=1033263 RepID=A0AAD7CV92_MYCRO|nr:NADP-dependent oxidoreductase domain-containing protein [Mycena rosella]
MVVRVTKLGGTASDITVGRVSHGLMMMTASPVASSDEDCFAAIKAGVDALPAGAKMFLNSGEFYSTTWGTENLELLARFYAKYPDYVDKTFLSVKGGVRGREPDSSMENLRKSMDLFEPARIDPAIPIEEAMANLICRAETLRRAHAVSPITAAEIEVSIWEYKEEQKRPLGKGFLTGKITSPADVPEGDHRKTFARFSEANMAHNMALVSALAAVAAKKGVTPGQLSIAWVAALGEHVIPLPGSSRATRTLENCAAGDVELSADEFAEVTEIGEQADVRGDRMAGGKPEYLWG